jgi:hypothetical protein
MAKKTLGDRRAGRRAEEREREDKDEKKVDSTQSICSGEDGDADGCLKPHELVFHVANAGAGLDAAINNEDRSSAAGWLGWVVGGGQRGNGHDCGGGGRANGITGLSRRTGNDVTTPHCGPD